MEDQLRYLLQVTIAYQDVMDDDTKTTIINRCKMMTEWDEANALFPEIMEKYDFEAYPSDRQLEFDNLQKFINDYREIK